MCQPMPVCLYTRWELDSETNRITPRQNKIRVSENMVMSYFIRTRPNCQVEGFYAAGRQKNDRLRIDCFCSHCNTVFEAMGCFYHFCPRQKFWPSLTEEDIERCSKKGELDQQRRSHIQKKASLLSECGGVLGGDCTIIVNKHLKFYS